jgi:hypothetical protein
MTNVELIRSTKVYQQARANGQGAQDAINGVRRHWAFIRDLSASVKQDKKRSKAAKRGWKTRRAA